MSAASTAARGRRFAEQQYESTCTIRGLATGEPTTDPNSGAVTPAARPVIYSGKCRVRPASSQRDSTTEAGGAELFTFEYMVSVPFSVTTVIEGHRLKITASPDPALVGMDLEIQQVARGEQITARRLSCREVS